MKQTFVDKNFRADSKTKLRRAIEHMNEEE